MWTCIAWVIVSRAFNPTPLPQGPLKLQLHHLLYNPPQKWEVGDLLEIIQRCFQQWLLEEEASSLTDEFIIPSQAASTNQEGDGSNTHPVHFRDSQTEIPPVAEKPLAQTSQTWVKIGMTLSHFIYAWNFPSSLPSKCNEECKSVKRYDFVLHCFWTMTRKKLIINMFFILFSKVFHFTVINLPDEWT